MTTHFFGDTAVLQGRSLRHITRSPDTIITTTIMPIAFMLLFVFVFGGAINSGSDSYVNYLLPGILIITIASGISYTAFRLFLDMKSASSSDSSPCRSHGRPCCGRTWGPRWSPI
jgi:ABC-2 type transport system permease protein